MLQTDGRCHCGLVTFEAEVDPESVYVCHCTDGQTLSGSGTFRLLSGALRRYVKTAASGRRRAQMFCPDCGTPVCSTTADEAPRVHVLRVGALGPGVGRRTRRAGSGETR